jgi:hypothetical protein
MEEIIEEVEIKEEKEVERVLHDIPTETTDLVESKSLLESINRFFTNFMSHLLTPTSLVSIRNEMHLFTLVLGVIIGYVFSRPREFLLQEAVKSLEYKYRQKTDQLLETASHVQELTEINIKAIAHNVELDQL